MYYNLDSWEQISVEYKSKYKIFFEKKIAFQRFKIAASLCWLIHQWG